MRETMTYVGLDVHARSTHAAAIDVASSNHAPTATPDTASTIGAFINGFGYTLALLNLAWAARFSKVKAPANPYESLSLEWQTQSPPIHENFEKTPVVTDWTYGYGKHA